MTVEKVSWRKLWSQAKPLMKTHWEEVRENRMGLEFDVDVAQAQMLENSGMMHCWGFYVSRVGLNQIDPPELVGYLIWFKVPMIEHRGHFMATLGPTYAREDCPGVGKQLWNEGLKWLKTADVDAAYTHVSEFGRRRAHTQRFFEAVGCHPYELKMELVLKSSKGLEDV